MLINISTHTSQRHPFGRSSRFHQMLCFKYTHVYAHTHTVRCKNRRKPPGFYCSCYFCLPCDLLRFTLFNRHHFFVILLRKIRFSLLLRLLNGHPISQKKPPHTLWSRSEYSILRLSTSSILLYFTLLLFVFSFTHQLQNRKYFKSFVEKQLRSLIYSH